MGFSCFFFSKEHFSYYFLRLLFYNKKMYASSVTASVSPLIFYLSFAFPN